MFKAALGSNWCVPMEYFLGVKINFIFSSFSLSFTHISFWKFEEGWNLRNSILSLWHIQYVCLCVSMSVKCVWVKLIDLIHWYEMDGGSLYGENKCIIARARNKQTNRTCWIHKQASYYIVCKYFWCVHSFKLDCFHTFILSFCVYAECIE